MGSNKNQHIANATLVVVVPFPASDVDGGDGGSSRVDGGEGRVGSGCAEAALENATGMTVADRPMGLPEGTSEGVEVVLTVVAGVVAV